MEAYDTWIILLDAKHKKTVLPDLFKVSKLAGCGAVSAHHAIREKAQTDFSCARFLLSAVSAANAERGSSGAESGIALGAHL